MCLVNSRVRALQENLLHSWSMGGSWRGEGVVEVGGRCGGYRWHDFHVRNFCFTFVPLLIFHSCSFSFFFSPHLFFFIFFLWVWRHGCKKVFQTSTRRGLKRNAPCVKNRPNLLGFDVFVAKKIHSCEDLLFVFIYPPPLAHNLRCKSSYLSQTFFLHGAFSSSSHFLVSCPVVRLSTETRCYLGPCDLTIWSLSWCFHAVIRFFFFFISIVDIVRHLCSCKYPQVDVDV